jgi:hypothetical protein
MPWPPATAPAAVRVAGNLDSREQRHALLDALARAPARRLLIACDARQTPDRGALALIADLAGKAAQTRVWLLAGDSGDSGNSGDHAPAAGASIDRAAAWRTRLIETGMAPEAIMRDLHEPLRWLGGEHA